MCVCACVYAVVQLCQSRVTPWTAACQAPLTGIICPWDYFPGKCTRVGCHFLLQGIFQNFKDQTCISSISSWILYQCAT